MTRITVSDIRYWLLAAALFALLAANTLKGNWIGDFWEHAAVVRELATHPWSPRHPLLDSDAPHAFFSPYSLTVALIARALRLAPVTALELAGMFNLLALLLVFPWFVRRLFGDADGDAVAFYGLLLVLFLWGRRAWNWSGFVHVFAIGYVLPYPSTFAFVLTLAAAASLLTWTQDRRRRWLLIALPSMVVVLLTHPTTAIILFALAFWILVARGGRSHLETVAVTGAALLGTLLVAQLWPYYNLAALLLQSSGDFHAANQELYGNVLPKVAPALVGIPLIAWRLYTNARDVPALLFLSLAGLYLLGAVTGAWGVARVISMMMIILQLTIAWGLARLEAYLATFGRRRAVVLRTALVAVVVYVLLFRVNSATIYTLKDMARRTARAHSEYAFLGRLTGQYDVVAADLWTGWPVPAFGGKVVASLHALAFIDDHRERRMHIERFFAMATPDGERRSFLARYGVEFILLDRSVQPAPLVEALSRLGELVHDDRRFVLLRATRASGNGATSPLADSARRRKV